MYVLPSLALAYLNFPDGFPNHPSSILETRQISNKMLHLRYMRFSPNSTPG